MAEKDDQLNKSASPSVQLHEIKPVAEGMSFGALLDKFYLTMEAANGPLAEEALKASDVVKSIVKSTQAKTG